MSQIHLKSVSRCQQEMFLITKTTDKPNQMFDTHEANNKELQIYTVKFFIKYY